MKEGFHFILRVLILLSWPSSEQRMGSQKVEPRDEPDTASGLDSPESHLIDQLPEMRNNAYKGLQMISTAYYCSCYGLLCRN
jgi:hypothetical protein